MSSKRSLPQPLPDRLGADAGAGKSAPQAEPSPSGVRRFPLRLDQVNGATAARVRGADAVVRPQPALQHAAAQRRHTNTPTGMGLDSVDVRRRMVERLYQGGLRHEAVLQAFLAVERHRFVDSALVIQAYEDTSLPIGYGQTISKPSVVGRMMELLMAGRTAQAQGHLGRVLEIGTGCGYQAAVLAQVSRLVVSIERLQALHEKARVNLQSLPPPAGAEPAGIRLLFADGMLGHPPTAPYDSIIAAAGGDALPPAWLEQLAVGGRLIAPVEQTDDTGHARQSLVVVDRDEQGFHQTLFEGVRFVPLKSGLSR
jgi:protein-L-isoaspartate(D-aspartate) O-methyltransferase